MSDRPMRLKYLTKMKIILCIFLLCITAVSVFGQSVELNGIVGESVKFPAAVKIDGSLRYSGAPIGDVTSARFTVPHIEKFSGRVQWDSSTGLFSLSELKMEDSGEYKVENTNQNINTVFQLNVYMGNVPVLKPHLSVTRNEYRCTVLCAAARGTGVTLTLYKKGETNPYVTSPGHSHPDLNVTVPVEGSSTYTCEAKNSVSRQTSDPLPVGAHCTAGLSAGLIAAIFFAVVAGIIAVVAVPIAVIFAVLYCRIKRKRRDTKRKRRDEDKHLLASVKTLLDNVDPRAYDEDKQSLTSAFRTLIQVKSLLDNVDPHAYDKDKQSLTSVKTLLDNVDTHAYDEEKQSFISAFRTLIHVKTLIENVDTHAYDKDKQSFTSAFRTLIQVKTFLDNADPHAHDEDKQSLIYHVRDFMLCRNAPKTEFPLNQATREVEEK